MLEKKMKKYVTKRIYRKDKHVSLRVVITYNKLRDTNDT